MMHPRIQNSLPGNSLTSLLLFLVSVVSFFSHCTCVFEDSISTTASFSHRWMKVSLIRRLGLLTLDGTHSVVEVEFAYSYFAIFGVNAWLVRCNILDNFLCRFLTGRSFFVTSSAKKPCLVLHVKRCGSEVVAVGYFLHDLSDKIFWIIILLSDVRIISFQFVHQCA